MLNYRTSTFFVLALFTFASMTLVSGQNVNVSSTCYERGSEGFDFFNNEEKVCKCKEGYFGADCDTCLPHIKNKGDVLNANCDHCFVEDATLMQQNEFVLRYISRIYTKETCQQRCQNHASCTHITYVKNYPNLCVLHGPRKFPIRNKHKKRIYAGDKFCTGKDEASCYSLNPDLPNLPIVVLGKNNIQDSAKKCHSNCLANPYCIYFEWDGTYASQDGTLSANPRPGAAPKNHCTLKASVKITEKTVPYNHAPDVGAKGTKSSTSFVAPKFCPTASSVTYPTNNGPNSCYAKGSIANSYFNNEVKACKCEQGYTGARCDSCMPYVPNTGTAKNPDCSTCLLPNVANTGFGNNFEHTNNFGSLQKCKTECQSKNDCTFYSHFPYYKSCTIVKDDFQEISSSSGGPIYTGDRFCVGDENTCYLKNQKVKKLPYIINGYKNIQDNPKKCHETCLKNNFCTYWVFNSPKKECILRTDNWINMRFDYYGISVGWGTCLQ